MIKLFVCDIDHTLYCSEKDYIPQENIDAILRLQKNGVRVVLASGRYLKGTLAFAKMLKLDEYDGYILSLNGSQVYRMRDGAFLQNECFNNEQMHELYAISKRIGAGFGFFTPEKKVVNCWSKISQYDFEKVGCEILVCANPMDYLCSGISQCSLTNDETGVTALGMKISNDEKQRYNFNCGQSTVIDISLPHISKKKGLDVVLKELGLEYDNVAAIGDGDNDAPMLEAAGLSGCVSNSSVMAKAAAQYQLCRDDEGAVACFINDHILKQNQ